VRKKAG